jgi:hypothetical protein
MCLCKELFKGTVSRDGFVHPETKKSKLQFFSIFSYPWKKSGGIKSPEYFSLCNFIPHSAPLTVILLYICESKYDDLKGID